jgi:hypothetical protein
MDDDALDIVRAQRRGKAVDLDIAEAVIGEMRLEAFACGIAAQHPAVGGTRGAQIGLIDRAILAQQFGETQGDGVSGLAFGFEADPTGEILPEIDHHGTLATRG